MTLFKRSQNVAEFRDLLSSASIPSNTAGWANISGRAVTTDSALRLSAVYACVGLIADALSTTPIDTYRRKSEGRREHIDTPSLLLKPSGQMVLVEWLFSFFSSLLLRGNTYGLKDDFDEFGFARQIHLVHPDDASVTRQSRQDPTPVYRFFGTEVPFDRVLHVKGFTLPGDLEGLSPIAYQAQTIGMGLAAGDWGAEFFGSGGQPSAVLETEQPVTQEQAAAIKARIVNQLRGPRSPLILGAGATWKPISVSPSDSQFLETMRSSVADVARIFHVPVEKIGGAVEGSGSVTYANREANVIEFQTDALLPNAVRFEEHMSRLLPGRQYVKFNMDAAIRVDLKTRYDSYAVGIESGFLLADEARELEDRAPLTPAQKAELAPPALAPATNGNGSAPVPATGGSNG